MVVVHKNLSEVQKAELNLRVSQKIQDDDNIIQSGLPKIKG